MIQRRYWVFLAMVLGAAPIARTQEQSPETLWSQAEQLRSKGLSEAAAQEYDYIVAQWPRWERAAQAALRAVEIYQKLGRTGEALAACDKALALANDFWLQPALFSKASVCLRADCRDDALAAIRRLRAEYPESTWTVRAGVIEAQLVGADPGPAKAALDRDLEAGKLYAQAMTLLGGNQREEALSVLEQMAAGYPDSPAALRALDTRGHLLIRFGRDREAMPVFADILLKAGRTTPAARIVRRAKARLGALCRASGRITEAQEVFEDLARHTDKPAVASRAALELIGMDYERLRGQLAPGREIDRPAWAALRQKCRDLAEAPWCQPRERLRADLVAVETYYWEDDAEGAAVAGAAFFEKYDALAFMNELVTARLFVGLVLKDAKRYPEAVECFRWILEHAPDPGSRAYRELWSALSRMGAPPEEIEEVEAALMARYPDSPSARYIELVKRQEAAGYVRNAR